MRTLMLLAGLALGTGSAWAQTLEPATPEKEAAPADPPAIAEPAKDSKAIPAAKPTGKPTDEAPDTQDPAAKEKFEQFTAAMKDLKSATFRAVFSVDGRAKEMFGTIEADVKALRSERGWGYRVTGKGRRTAKAPEVDFDIVNADGASTWLDQEAKKLITKPTASAHGKALDAASNLRSLSNLFQPVPFPKEKAAKDLTVRDAEKVGDVECDVIAAATSGAGGEMVFFLGKEDHLPRKIVSERTSSSGTIMSILEFKNFKANDKVEPSALEIALPDGFTREESKPMSAPAAPRISKAVDTSKPLSQKPDGSPEIAPGEQAGGPANPTEMEGTSEIRVADPDAANPAKAAPSPGSPAAGAPDTGFPVFDLKTADGKSVTNDTLRGKPAIVMFFGTWSLSSKKAYPELKLAVERYKDKASIYAACVRQKDSADAKRALTEAGVEAPLLVGADKLADSLKIGSFPALYILSADGEILKHPTTGKMDEAFREATAALDAALGLAPAVPPAAPPAAPAAPAGTDAAPPTGDAQK